VTASKHTSVQVPTLGPVYIGKDVSGIGLTALVLWKTRRVALFPLVVEQFKEPR